MKRQINSFKIIKNWRAFWKFYYAVKNFEEVTDFTAHLRNGHSLIIPKDLVSAFDEIYLRKVYEKKLENISATPLIIDIGANVGYATMFMLSKYPKAKIYACEPMPANIKLISEHKSINNLENLTIVERAVITGQDKLSMNFKDNFDFAVGATALDKKKYVKVLKDTAINTLEVDAMSIADIFDEFQIDSCDLMKVDCEGSEYNNLFNCPDEYFKRIKNIVIEVHDWIPKEEGTPAELIEFLESKNYKTEFIKNEILWCQRV